MEKPATTDYEILDVLRRRWSTRAISSQPVERDKLLSALEAARWAPSSSNGQPWAFIVAERADQEAHAGLAAALTGRNPLWAPRAPVLLLVAAHLNWRSGSREGQPNRHAVYDTGQAIAYFTMQAVELGLVVHRMAGFDRVRAAEVVGLPKDVEPIAMAAVGYPGSPEALPDPLHDEEYNPRQRRPQLEFTHWGRWGQTAPARPTELASNHRS